jgi:hypothetical protein
MKRILLTLTAISISLGLFSQSINWHHQLGSNEFQVNDIAIANNGDFAMTGIFSGNTNFNPNGSNHVLNHNNTGALFIASYKSNSDLKWAYQFSESHKANGLATSIDSRGNIYTLGTFEGTIDFDTSSVTQEVSSTSTHYFLVKYDSTGTCKWVRNLGIHPNSVMTYFYRYKILNDPKSSNIYTYCSDTLRCFNQNGTEQWKKMITGLPIINEHGSIFYIDKFKQIEINSLSINQTICKLHKINKNGINTYSKNIINPNKGIMNGYIKLLNDGSIIISGAYWGKSTFYNTADSIIIINNKMEISMPSTNPQPELYEFIAKTDTLGDVSWAHGYHGESPMPQMIQCDNDGNIYTTGSIWSNTNISFDTAKIVRPYQNQISYIAKYDSDFNYLAHALFLNGSSLTTGFEFSNDTVLLAGSFYNSIDIDPTINNVTLNNTSVNKRQTYLVKFTNFNITSNPAGVTTHNSSQIPWTFYPNPANNSITIKGLKAYTEYKIFDCTGKIVLRGSTHQHIDISNLNRGLYYLQIEQSQSRKFIKL